MKAKPVGGTLAALCAATGLAVTTTSPAAAEVRTGWIGATPPIGGIVYLHTSTIDNGGVPKASSRIYTSFGQTVPQGTIGAKARLFREGALCGATDYQFNLFISNQQNAAVTKDCGPGFYNSHGFVAVYPAGGTMSEYVTFPSDPLQYPATGVAAAAAVDTTPGVNGSGQRYGSAADITDDANLPDLVLAIGRNGETGYIAATDLRTPQPDPNAAVVAREVELLDREGKPTGATFQFQSP